MRSLESNRISKKNINNNNKILSTDFLDRYLELNISFLSRYSLW